MKSICKRSLTMLLAALLIVSLAVPSVMALEPTDIFSNEALVVDRNTDTVLYSKDTNPGSVEIASLTKVMTYVLSVENIADLSVKIKVPVGTKQEIAEQDGSNSGLEDEYEYTALDLLYGLMLPSGCDAADVLAEHVSAIVGKDFIEMMNEKALELGMENTTFYSASGLSKDGMNNISTEQDLYKLAKYAYDLPHFRKIIGTEFYTVTGTKDESVDENTVQNTNYMMGEYNGAEYYYIYSLGGKTGNTSGAGRCLISYAQKGDLELVAITLGVPNEHSNYHLTDHKKLLDYVFDTYTENITVDLGTEYKSVGIGEKLELIPTTSEETHITWTSSDPSVAEVNEYGIVTGIKMGQARITATTATGNQDYTYVSVGFYNGVDVKYNAGPSDPNGILGYGELDWSVVKNYGMDFAIIRAGYALDNNPDSDPYFVTNIQNAFAHGLNVMISFDGYATDASYAEKEAEYFLNYINENIPDYLDGINLPIVYNLYPSSVTDPQVLKEVIFAFQSKLEEAGYRIVVEMGKTLMSTLDLAQITEAGIDLYIIYKPYVPNYQTKMYATSNGVDYNADIWQYRGDAYFGDTGIAKRITMSAMYMDSFQVDTDHDIYDDSLYPEKPELTVTGSYMYNGQEQIAEVSGYDPQTMQITGSTATDAGTYTITVTPSIRWKDFSTDPVTVTWIIEKADPEVTLPVLTAKNGTRLKEIALPEHFSWKDPDATVDSQTRFAVIYTPEDSDNYNTIELELEITLIPTITEEEDKQDPTTPTKPNNNNTGTNTNTNTNTGTQKPVDKVETESTEEEVVLEKNTTEPEIPVEKEEPVTESIPQKNTEPVTESVPQENTEPVTESVPQGNTEPVVTVPEQPVEEEILPTPVKKAEFSIRPVIWVFTGITALATIAGIFVLVLRKKR